MTSGEIIFAMSETTLRESVPVYRTETGEVPKAALTAAAEVDFDKDRTKAITKPRTKKRHRYTGRSGPVTEIQVDPEVMAVARAHCGPSQRIVLVSATEVRIVNRHD